MDWKEMLTAEAREAYHATLGMLDLVDDDALGWKPETGDNWMTTGQLLRHLTTACGFCCRAFLTGDWGLPEGGDVSEMSSDEMLPAADALPSAESVAAARAALESDRDLCLAVIDEASAEDLANRLVPAPWNPAPTALGRQLLMSINHLNSHKSQLFYYLKLQGRPVHTGTLWGM